MSDILQKSPAPGGVGGVKAPMFSPDIKGVIASGQEAARLEGERNVAGADVMARAADQRVQADTAAMDRARQDTRSVPAFVPTKDTAADLSSLFGLIGVVGTALGSKGQGMNAMSAMTGMMQGYQQGNEDRYAKEYQKFQTSMQEMQRHNEQVQQELQRALKISETNMEAGKAHASLAMAKLDAPMLRAKVEHQGVLEAYKVAQQMASEERRLRQTIAAENLRQQHALARDEAKAALKGGVLGEANLDAEAQAIALNAAKMPSISSPRRGPLIAKVKQINPDWNEQDYGNQAKAYSQWSSSNGAGGKQIIAFNTVADHLLYYEMLAGELNNTDTPKLNAVINYVKREIGDTSVTNAQAAKQSIAAEIVKAISNVSGALADRQEAESILNLSATPEQMRGTVNTLRGLIGGRFNSALHMFRVGTGRNDKAFFEMLTPEAKKTFGKYADVSSAPSSAPAAAAEPTASIPSFSTEAEAEAAVKAGKIKKGDKVTIGGVTGTWE